jgi:hypothetical protein
MWVPPWVRCIRQNGRGHSSEPGAGYRARIGARGSDGPRLLGASDPRCAAAVDGAAAGRGHGADRFQRVRGRQVGRAAAVQRIRRRGPGAASRRAQWHGLLGIPRARGYGGPFPGRLWPSHGDHRSGPREVSVRGGFRRWGHLCGGRVPVRGRPAHGRTPVHGLQEGSTPRRPGVAQRAHRLGAPSAERVLVREAAVARGSGRVVATGWPWFRSHAGG